MDQTDNPEDNPDQAGEGAGAEPNVVASQPSADQERTEPAPDSQEPIGPTLDLEQIILETLDIAEYNNRRAQDQQLQNQKNIFMLTNVLDNLKAYKEHVDKINTFLVNNDIQQSEWYYKMCEQLPSYGDYSGLFNDSSVDRIQLEGVAAPVPEADLKKLVTEITNNFYAGGAHVRTQRILCKTIYEEIKDRRKFLLETRSKFPMWFSMSNSVVRHYNILKELIFKVTAHVNFLKTGEIDEPLRLDVKKALQSP